MRREPYIRDPLNKRVYTKYTFMIDTKMRPGDLFSGGELAYFLEEVMQMYAPNAEKYLIYNKRGEGADYIEEIKIRFSIEGMTPNPNPRITKSGHPDRRGGTVHLHGTILVVHRTNIKMDYDKFRQFVEPLLEEMTTRKPFISTFRLTNYDMTEPYMTKDDRYSDGWHWETTEYN
jgi:hypothetical protein